MDKPGKGEVVLSKIYGSIALILMLLSPGAVEGEMYITAVVMICGMALFAYLSMREEKKEQKNSTR